MFDYESKGRGFESRRAHQEKALKRNSFKAFSFCFALCLLLLTPIFGGSKRGSKRFWGSKRGSKFAYVLRCFYLLNLRPGKEMRRCHVVTAVCFHFLTAVFFDYLCDPLPPKLDSQCCMFSILDHISTVLPYFILRTSSFRDFQVSFMLITFFSLYSFSALVPSGRGKYSCGVIRLAAYTRFRRSNR